MKTPLPIVKRMFTLAATALVVSLAAPAIATTPEGWTHDFEAAVREAKENDRNLLLNFTGSDWCPPCQQLSADVFSTATFLEGTSDDYVLVYLDFPSRAPIPDAVRQQNNRLQQQYEIRGYPTVILTDSEGRPLDQHVGYRPGGPEAYLAEFTSKALETRQTRDEAMARADEAQGAERAKLLDEALSGLDPDLARSHYDDVVEEIVQLDADDELGLKTKYTTRQISDNFQQEVMRFRQGVDPADLDDAREYFEQLMEKFGDEPQQAQMLHIQMVQVLFAGGETQEAAELAKAGAEIDQNSQLGEALASMAQQIEARGQ